MAGHCSSDRISKSVATFGFAQGGGARHPLRAVLRWPYHIVLFSVGANYGAEGAMGSEEGL